MPDTSKYKCNVAAAKFFAVSNVTNAPSIATCFARRRRLEYALDGRLRMALSFDNDSVLQQVSSCRTESCLCFLTRQSSPQLNSNSSLRSSGFAPRQQNDVRRKGSNQRTFHREICHRSSGAELDLCQNVLHTGDRGFPGRIARFFPASCQVVLASHRP